MATNDIRILKLTATPDWEEKTVTAEANKVLGFDGSVNPVMVTAGDMTLAGVQSVTGEKTFDDSKLALKGSSTGKIILKSTYSGAGDVSVYLPPNNAVISQPGLAETITGVKTFSKDKLLVKGTSTGTTNITTENTSATDYTATLQAVTGTIALTADLHTQNTDSVLALGAPLTGDATYKGITMVVTVDTNAVGAGALLAIGSDGNFDEADADAIANMYMLVLAITTGTGASKTVLVQGQICYTAWNWTVGTPIYASLTQGTLTQTAPAAGTDDVNVIVGFALSADTMYFNPYSALVVRA